MSWIDQLQPASWRGINFEVESASSSYGRRGAEKEFPNIDGGIKEDQGRKQRKFTIEAFLVGDDFMQRRNALIAACEDRQNSGSLILPWEGAQKVCLNSADVQHVSLDGRMCRISLEFCEHVDLPSFGLRNLFGIIKGILNGFLSSFTSRFSRIISDLGNVNKTPIIAAFEPFQNNILDSSFIHAEDTNIDFQTAFDAPETFIQNAADFFSHEYQNSTVKYIRKQALQVNDHLSEMIQSHAPKTSYGYLDTYLGKENTAITQIATALMTANIHAVSNVILESDFYTHNEARIMLETAYELIDHYGAASPNNYHDLITLKTELTTYIVENYADLAQENTIQINSAIPTIALAYDLYEDITREEGIIKRNNIIHPLFTPAGSLEVLNQ